MVNKIRRGSDGLYHVGKKSFKKLVGSRPEVMHGTAYKTKGDKKIKDFLYNKHGRIVSRVKSIRAKKEKRLEKAGYFTKKGVFGYVKRNVSRSSTRKRKGRK